MQSRITLLHDVSTEMKRIMINPSWLNLKYNKIYRKLCHNPNHISMINRADASHNRINWQLCHFARACVCSLRVIQVTFLYHPRKSSIDLGSNWNETIRALFEQHFALPKPFLLSSSLFSTARVKDTFRNAFMFFL